MSITDALRRRMDDHKEQLIDYIAYGGPADFTEYTRAVAKLEALELIRNDIAEIEKKYIED